MLKRFIPTHVGNMPSCPATVSRPPVHPHACGEYVIWSGFTTTPSGSSPRMWGISYSARHLPHCLRFIPTHVGNILSCHGSSPRASVHPHACGEYLGEITPTEQVRVHPHACGEYWMNHRPPIFAAGSSPRMWGISGGPGAGFLFCRFIPTHVGNMDSMDFAVAPLTVHPHACGEYHPPQPKRSLYIGSSPRMWGICS